MHVSIRAQHYVLHHETSVLYKLSKQTMESKSNLSYYYDFNLPMRPFTLHVLQKPVEDTLAYISYIQYNPFRFLRQHVYAIKSEPSPTLDANKQPNIANTQYISEYTILDKEYNVNLHETFDDYS